MSHKCQFPNGVEVHIGERPLSPCKFVLSEIYKNVTVEILKCPICGEVSVGWYRQDNTEDILVED